MGESENVVEETRLNLLKKKFKMITDRREAKVINKLVQEYRDGELSQEKAYSAIMAIAELRWAGNDIEQKDLQ